MISVMPLSNTACSLQNPALTIIDIGGESTRPGALPVALETELQRTIPVIQELARRITVPISIDTTKAEVARQAVEAGAAIINDISGLTFETQMLEVCRSTNAGICLMHIQGHPKPCNRRRIMVMW